jgi:Cu+-exporting ATPase
VPDRATERARTFDVVGMTCATCARRVERALSKVEGVERTEVDLVRERARVIAPPSVPDAILVRSVEALGYQLAPIAPSGRTGASSERARSAVALRAGLALVLAALTMLVAMVRAIPGRPWLEIALAAACVLGCGAPILRKALRELLARAASMDTLVSLGALAALASATADAAAHGEHAHGYAESAAAIVAFVLLGRALEARARRAAGEALRALSSLRPETARVIRHGVEAEIPAAELRPGDRARVRANERIPADGTLDEGEAWIDESWLTGESAPVHRSAGGRLLAGTLAAGQALRMTVTEAGEGTELARVERLVDHAQSSRAPIVRLADRVSAIFVPIVIGLALATLVIWIVALGDVDRGIASAVTLLVVACPCALGLAAPAAITVAVGRAAERGILVRDAAALEALARVRVVALDKTGTLTEGRPLLIGERALEGDIDRALALAAAIELESEHPIARAIVSAAMERQLGVPDASAVEARTSVGVRGVASGIDVEVRSLDPATERALPEDARVELTAWRARGATVAIVLAGGRAVALFAVRDALRPHARESIAALRALGLAVRALSGDHPESVQAIARELGLAPDEVRGALRPEDKTEQLTRLRRELGPVAMVGDGVNDAPALALADVGIAIGTGAEAARRAAEVTLVHGDPRRIGDAIGLARKTVRVIRRNLALAFVYNALMIPLAATSVLAAAGGPVLASAAMALSSLTVLGSSLSLRRA